MSKFKVGEKVIIVQNTGPVSFEYLPWEIGDTVTVTEVKHVGVLYDKIVYTIDNYCTVYFKEEELSHGIKIL